MYYEDWGMGLLGVVISFAPRNSGEFKTHILHQWISGIAGAYACLKNKRTEFDSWGIHHYGAIV